MGAFEFAIIAVAVGLVAFQTWLTIRVFRSGLYDRKQKLWQTQLIWLLPVIGAGLVFSILQEDSKAERPTQAKQIAKKS
jgi:hypothetical protein